MRAPTQQCDYRSGSAGLQASVGGAPLNIVIPSAGGQVRRRSRGIRGSGRAGLQASVGRPPLNIVIPSAGGRGCRRSRGICGPPAEAGTFLSRRATSENKTKSRLQTTAPLPPTKVGSSPNYIGPNADLKVRSTRATVETRDPMVRKVALAARLYASALASSVAAGAAGAAASSLPPSFKIFTFTGTLTSLCSLSDTWWLPTVFSGSFS